MNHSYTVKDMSCGMGLKMRIEFEDKNAKGEQIIVELVSCTRDPGSRSLPILWKTKGLIDSGIKLILIGCLKTRRKTEPASLRKFAVKRLRR